MEQRTDENLSPYRTYSRAQWATLREDTPMTLTAEEVTRLRSLHDRLDMAEVEEIYLPLSRLLSMYVVATQRLFRAQQRFLGTEDAKMPYVIAWPVRWRSGSLPRHVCCKLCWRAGRMCRRSI